MCAVVVFQVFFLVVTVVVTAVVATTINRELQNLDHSVIVYDTACR